MSQWDGLKKEEIGTLIKKYSKIVRSLRSEYNKRCNVYNIEITLPGDIQKTALNLLGILSIKDNVIRTDVSNLSEDFYKYYDWSNSHGAYSNETLAVCITTEVLNHWMIHYDLDYILEMFGIDKKSYNQLLYKVNMYAETEYWKV